MKIIIFTLICSHINDLKAKSILFEDFMLIYHTWNWVPKASEFPSALHIFSQHSQNFSTLLRSHYLTHGIVAGPPHSHYQKAAPDGVSNWVASYKNHRIWTKLCYSSWRLTAVIKNELEEQNRGSRGIIKL